jgi:hypothetical protein
MGYPGHREADVALRDGSTAHVRPAREADAPAVRAFFEHLSPESTALRFFSGFPDLDSAVAWATKVTTGAATACSRPAATAGCWPTPAGSGTRTGPTGPRSP